MEFRETKLKGAYIIELERLKDERGFFARSYCQKEFEAHGLNPNIAQCNVSFNAKKGTMRGMHYQYPNWEAKLVRITKGSIYDVIVDLRPESPTYLKHIGVELSDNNQKMLYVPESFGHGFLTLEDNTEVFYQMSEFYIPENARGFRYDDTSFRIKWPIEVQVISRRDMTYVDFQA
jgi:dTDP-4-dehydrorhamnose 3,5-epimerase